jgi:hypothetical protein
MPRRHGYGRSSLDHRMRLSALRPKRAFRQFESNKSIAFTCSVIDHYANREQSAEWRRFPRRVFAFISSPPAPIVNSPLYCSELDGECERL